MDLEKLERLANLRDSGAITQEEFETEKAKLLGGPEQNEPAYHDDHDPPRRTGKAIGWAFATLLVGGGAAMFAGGLVPSSTIPSDASAVDTNDSAWKFSTVTDPMSDRQIVTASRRIDAGEHNIDAEIRCTDSMSLDYELTISRKDGTPDWIEDQANIIGQRVRFYDLRLDSAQAITAMTSSRHPNVISTDSSESPGYSLYDSQKMAAATKLKFQVPMQHNELTFELPQTDRPIREFLEGCHKVDPNANFVPSEQEQVPEATPEQTGAPADSTDEQPQTDDVAQPEGNSDS